MPPELPPNPAEINVPFDQLVYIPDPLYPTMRRYVWPSEANKLLEFYYSETASVRSVLPTINLGGDSSFGYGSGFSLQIWKSDQINISFSYFVPDKLLNGDPNIGYENIKLECMDTHFQTHYVYSGDSISFISPAVIPPFGQNSSRHQVSCNQRDGRYGQVTLKKITFLPYPTIADISIDAPLFPNAKVDSNDGLPILAKNEMIKVNVPVLMSNPNNVTPEQRAKNISVKLNMGSEIFSKMISVADLANAGILLVVFEVKPQNLEPGISRVSVSVDSEGVFLEEFPANNVNFKNVHVIDEGKLNLRISALDLEGGDRCNFDITGPLDSRICQAGKISDGDVLNVPFGSILKLALVNEENEIIPVVVQLVEDSLALNSEIESYSLFPNQLAVLFEPDLAKLYQSLITVHLGTQQVKFTPLDASIDPFTVVLNSVSSETIGDANNTYDEIIISRAHQVGIPPQFIKGQVAQESGVRFDPDAYRYEPITNDMKLIQPKISNSSTSYAFKDKTDSKRYGKYLFRPKDRLSTDLDLINKRSRYRVKIGTGTPELVPIDYETKVKKNTYTPLYIRDLLVSNPKQNWDEADNYQYYFDRSGNKIAQTIISSSYGLMQIMYTTALDMGYVNSGVGKDPALLLDPETNINLATKYLIKCVKVVNGFQKSGPNPQMSINDLNLYIQFGFAGYNEGLNQRKASKRNYNFKYRENVLNNSKKYPILFKNEIL